MKECRVGGIYSAFCTPMTFLEKLERQLGMPPPEETRKTPKEDYLSSGSTILNLASTGRTDGCYVKGRYYRYCGDSSSGKTFLTLTCLAEAAINPSFDDYQLIHNDAENGALFDFNKFFGSRCAERVQPPRGTQENPEYSESVEDFYDTLNDAMDRGPCIYIMDSMDVLMPRDELKKYNKQKAARKKEREQGKEYDESGSYGLAKQRLNSQLLRLAVPKLRRTKSILIIVSQTRDKPGQFVTFGDTRVSGGGHSLKFYAGLEMWTSVRGKIKKKVRNKDREMGIYSFVRIKKNRQTGKDRAAVIPIYHSFGIDDVGANVDYLLEEMHWKKKFGSIKAKEFDLSATRENLIEDIQDDPKKVKELRMIVKKVWNSIENQCTINRKSRYM